MARPVLSSFTLLVCFFVVVGVLAVIAGRAHMLQSAHAESFTADGQDASETSFCMDDVCVTRRQLAMLQELSQDPSAACGSLASTTQRPRVNKPRKVAAAAPPVKDDIASAMPYMDDEQDVVVSKPPAVVRKAPPAVSASPVDATPAAAADDMNADVEKEDTRSAWRREFDARLATMTPEQRKAEWDKVIARNKARAAGDSSDVEGFTSSSFLPSIDLYRYAA